jgi:glycosyltransferase involved in cell wall biosynthesis
VTRSFEGGAPPLPRVKIALVHDWLTGMRGGEKVLEVLCELYPDAELFSLIYTEGSVSPTIARLRRRTSFIQRLPAARRWYRQYLPLFPVAIEQFDLDRFDLVISTSHCAAKSAVTPGRARHLCYCFTPMRYAWDQFEAYFGRERVGPVASRLLRPVIAWLARWDAATAGRADRYLAISQHVARRIGRYYNRSAHVVYPPVDTRFYHPDGAEPGADFLIVSALVPYKRVDLAIQACRGRGERLKIVGQGPELERLRHMADTSIEFLGSRTDEEIRQLYRQAQAVILPGEEDFGIAPLEAQACGRPVVALGRGGALETVVDGVTGVLVPDATAESLAEGLDRVRHLPFDSAVIRRHAEQFSRERFAEEMRREIEAFARHGT